MNIVCLVLGIAVALGAIISPWIKNDIDHLMMMSIGTVAGAFIWFSISETPVAFGFVGGAAIMGLMANMLVHRDYKVKVKR